MLIQTNAPRNPYAALALMTRQGALGTEDPQGLFPEVRAPLARRPLPGLAHAAPILRSQLMARVERYEGLGEQISTLRSALSQFVSATTRHASSISGLARVGMPHESTSSAPLAPGSTATGSAGTPASTGSPSTGSAPSTGSSGSSGGTRLVSDPAVMLGTERISLTPPTMGNGGKPGTQASLITDPLELRGTVTTFAELKGGAIELSSDEKGYTRFGKMILNGQTITFSPYKGDSATEAVQFLADQINNFKAKTNVVASVDPETGDRLILRSTIPGQGKISITELEVKKKNPGWTGFEEGAFAQGQTGASNLGTVTINGIKTDFGIRQHASAQEALAYMAARLNEDHEDLEATVQDGRLVLTSKANGYDAQIRVDAVTYGAVKQAPTDSSNGFTAGILARGSDAEPATPDNPGVTDFGRISINGIETVFGLLDNREHTAASAAQFLAQRINETNETVRASVEDGRLKLVSAQDGPNATIRIDALAADSDGNRDNDRALGFVLGAQSTGSERNVPTGGTGGSGGSGGTGSTGTSGSSASTAASEADATPRLTEQESLDLSEQIKAWTRLTNEYLTALDKRSTEVDHGQGELRAFSRTIASMVKQDDAFTAIGVTVAGGRLSLDETRLAEALTTDPEATLGAIQQFRDTLDPLLASQAYSMDFLREVASSLHQQVPSISQAKAMQFKLEQRSKEVALHLETLSKLLPTLSEQDDRLKSLAPQEDDDEDAKGDDPESPARAKEKASPMQVPAPLAWEKEPPRSLAALSNPMRLGTI